MVSGFADNFEIKESNEFDRFFGIAIVGEGDFSSLHKGPMVKSILKCSNMNECKPTHTPPSPGDDLIESYGPDQTDHTSYSKIVCSFIHLPYAVQPDIWYAVIFSAGDIHKPNQVFQMATKVVFKYLRRTSRWCLVYKTGAETESESYADAGCAQGYSNRKAICVYCCKCQVAW